MAHQHSHETDHASPHQPGDFGRAFAIGIALNIGFVIVESVFGVVANSMALLADAGHNLSDVLGLVIAWAGAALGSRPPTSRFTYGYRGASILAALFNGMLLLVAAGAIAWEALTRFAAPEPVAGTTVMVVAGIGILINGFTAWLFAAGRHSDINIRGAFLHMAADAVVSLGVVITGILILATGILLLDPVVSLVIVAVILWSTWGLLRESISMSLAAVPEGIDADGIRRFLEERPGVARLHDLHIWPLSTTEVALTAHLVMPSGHPGNAFLATIASELRHHHRIHHTTIQIEIDGEEECAQAPDDVV